MSIALYVSDLQCQIQFFLHLALGNHVLEYLSLSGIVNLVKICCFMCMSILLPMYVCILCVWFYHQSPKEGGHQIP